MESANIKMIDLLSELSPKPQGQVPVEGVSLGESNAIGFVAMFGDLVGGLVPTQLEEQAIVLPQALHTESSDAIETTEQITLSTFGAESKEPNVAEKKQTPTAQPIQSNKNLQSLVELLNAKTTDDTATLKLAEVVSQLKSEEPMLLQGKNAQSVDTSKNSVSISLDGSKSAFEFPTDNISSSLVNDKLAKLNVKEITIKAHQEDANIIDKLLILDLSAVKIKEQLDNSVTGQNKNNNLTASNVITGNTESTDNANDFIDSHAKSNINVNSKLVNSQATSDGAVAEFDTILNKTNQSAHSKIEQHSIIDLKTISAKSSGTVESSIEQSSHSVKIIIPESAKLNSSQQHQSIMIKIEPDHLGPARLDLQLKHDIFSAKLTVETVEAKAVLEHSIHSLREQLARANIKVEQIEINVRGETSYNQMFDKQPQWQKQSQINQFRFSNDELNEQFVPVGSTFVPQSLQFVNHSGVNVLA